MCPSMEWLSDDGIVDRIVSLTADRSGCEPMDLPVLYEAVDPDALAALLESADRSVTVEFGYAGHTVVADSEGSVDVRED